MAPEDLYFGYEIKKGASYEWAPVRVFDDGVKTYIEMPAKYKSLEAPVVMFFEGRQKKIVNYRVKDRFYVIDRVMSAKAELLLGQKQVVIQRLAPAKKKYPYKRGIDNQWLLFWDWMKDLREKNGRRGRKF